MIQIHRKKHWGHQKSKIVKSINKALAMAICLIIWLLNRAAVGWAVSCFALGLLLLTARPWAERGSCSARVFFLNRAAVGWAVSCSAFGFFKPRSRRLGGFLLCLRFFFFFVGKQTQTPTANCLHRMMSSSANYRPFLSSFRHISPSGWFCQVSEVTVYTKNGGLRRWTSGHLQG